MTHIKNKILTIVEHNKLSMIPRWKFVLYSALGVAGVLFSFLALIFTASVVVFILSKYGFVYLPLFGFGATVHLLMSLPVLLGIVAIILLFITEILVRQYAFAFRKPLVITLFVTTASALGIGFLVSLTPIHHTLRDFGRVHHIGMMEHMYDRPVPFGPMQGMTVLRGVVIATSTNTVRIQLFDDTEVTVYASTSLPKVFFPKYADEVVVFGTIVDGTFEAVKVRILSPEDVLRMEARVQQGRPMMR
jgi:hypothetical protein